MHGANGEKALFLGLQLGKMLFHKFCRNGARNTLPIGKKYCRRAVDFYSLGNGFGLFDGCGTVPIAGRLRAVQHVVGPCRTVVFRAPEFPRHRIGIRMNRQRKQKRIDRYVVDFGQFLLSSLQ